MLSIENPPPADPQPRQVKKNSVGYNDKKLTNLPDLDPSSSSSLDHHNHNPNQIPNFSIRDYVFSARSKDINKNWPFSLENLQLCFKHGIKDPLPPFRTLDAVRHQSSKPSAVATISIAEAKQDNHLKLEDAQTSQKLTDHSRKRKPGTENELLCTSTTVYQSEIESLEADQPVLEPTAENPPLRSSKTETTNKHTSKKCRLVVKFGAISAEDIASNSTSVSELMASKTCPVCKTFSSSSNTTLNAHIDQCLSADSKPESVHDSKIVRHKIKPKKIIRLMTDIYATAKRCTLEELDRRNGTSWALLASNLRASDTDTADFPVEGETQRVSPCCSNEVSGDQAPVYIDANGTKVRILSKFDVATAVPKESNDHGPNKSLKGDKRGKFFSTKKKSRHGKKRHKYLKVVPQSGKLLPQKAHASQVSAGQDGHSGEGNQKKDELQIPKKSKSVQLPGTSSQCVPSKCTALAKEMNKKGCKRKPTAENDQSRLGNSFMRRHQVQKLSGSSRNKVGNMEKSLLPMKRNTDQVSKVSPTPRPPENNRNCVSSLAKKKFCPDAVNYSDTPPCAGLVKPIFRSRTLKFSSTGKKVFIRHESVLKPKFNEAKKQFSIKSTRPRMDEEDEDIAAPQPMMDQECDLTTGDHCEGEKVSNDMSREETVASKCSQMVPQGHHQGNGESTDSSFKADLDDDDDDDDNNDIDSTSDDDDDDLDDFDGQEPTIGGASSLSKFLDKTPLDSSQSDEPHFHRVQEMYSTHDIAIGIPEQAVHMGVELDCELGQANSFLEVEPIPIPGPPGSYLPSPRGMMGPDDFPGNSSLTTSPVQSSEDHCDFFYRNSSDSPVSMASTVSNSTPARSDHVKHSEIHQMNAEAERNFEGEKFSVDKVSFEKTPFAFRNDQPCCCQRKERFSQGIITLDYQESQLLRRRTMTSTERQVGVSINPNLKSNNLDLRPDMTTFSNLPVSGHAKLTTVPMRKPLAEEPNFSKRNSDVERASSSPSASNPILRLMGKNLMVVNTEGDASTPLSHGDLSSTHDNLTPQFPATPRVHSFHHTPPRGSLMFGPDPCAALGIFDARNHFGNNNNSRVPQNPAQVMFRTHCMSPFTTFIPHESSVQGEVPVMQNADFNGIPLRRINTSPVRLGTCTPEGSGKFHRGSLVAASSSTTHLGSALHFS